MRGLKKELIERQCRGLVEFLEPKWNIDILVGHAPVKQRLRDDAELLQRGASDVEFADASCLKINVHVLTGEHPLAIDTALTCLRRFGIDLPAHPTWEQVQAEYETVWQTLKGRPIESLIDLPLMTAARGGR